MAGRPAGLSDDDSVDLDRPEDAGIDNDYGEATPGLFTNPSRRTPGGFSKVTPMNGKGGDYVMDVGEGQTNRTNADSQRKLLDKGKGKNEDN